MAPSQTDFIDLLTQEAGLKPASVVRTGVNLRKEGLLQVGGRGPYAPELSHEDAANIFLGAIVPEHTPDAAAVVRRYLNLAIDMEAVHRVKGAAEIVADVRTFGRALTTIIFSLDFARTVYSIQINRTFPEAYIILYRKHFHETYSLNDTLPIYFSDPEAKRTAGVQTWAFVDGGILTRLSNFVNRYEPTPEDLFEI